MKSSGLCLFLLTFLIFESCDKKGVLLMDNYMNCTDFKVVDGDTLRRLDIQCFIGNEIHDISGNTLSDSKSYYNLESSDAEFHLFNLWFSNCPPCIAEIPVFNEVMELCSEIDIDFVSVCKDEVVNEIDFINKHSFNFIHLTNSHDSISNWFPKTGFPTTYILNSNKEIVYVGNSGVYNEYSARKLKNSLLNIFNPN